MEVLCDSDPEIVVLSVKPAVAMDSMWAGGASQGTCRERHLVECSFETLYIPPFHTPTSHAAGAVHAYGDLEMGLSTVAGRDTAVPHRIVIEL